MSSSARQNLDQTTLSSSSSDINIRHSSSSTHINHDAVDYTGAYLRETQRRQDSRELLEHNAGMLANTSKVQLGYVTELMKPKGSISNKDILFDVLPSFEMYQSLQYSNPQESFDPDIHELPPAYNLKPEPQRPTLTSYFSNDSQISPNISTLDGQLLHSEDFISPSVSGTSTPAPLEPSQSNDIYSGKSVIDNVYKLPHWRSENIEIEIVVTKDVPSPSEKSQPASSLKEYTSGDIVHGYFTIKNTSSKSIPFKMFYLTLEGEISIINHKSKKQVLKKFLNMMDISASWSYADVSTSSNLTFVAESFDQEGCFLGLRNDRILEPNVVYKKFFTFKLPYRALDNNCHHQQELHNLLPPSFGLNRLKKGNVGLQVNDLLGYGHTGKRGSPILTRDLAGDALSIHYGINATLLGFHPNKPDYTQIMVLSEAEHALRFIPFGFGTSLFSSERGLISLKNLIEQTFRTAERGLKLMLEGHQREVEEHDRQVKLDQLRVGPVDGSEEQYINFPIRNQKNPSLDFLRLEARFDYTAEKKNLLSKFKSGSNAPVNGLITVSTNLPNEGLPYISPSLIRKTNQISNLDNQGYANYNLMDSSLSQTEKETLSLLRIDITFSPTEQDSEPPNVKSVETKLLAMNVYSLTAIPIKLSADIFLDEQNEKIRELRDEFRQYKLKLFELEKEFEKYGLDIKKYIPTQIVQDIKAMNSLRLDTHALSVFENHITTSKWTKSNTGNAWEQSLDLSIAFKKNIEETLIPTFQTCVLSRVYCIQIEVKFKGNQSTTLRVPIRLRNFDGN